jgi:hypothetical protein
LAQTCNQKLEYETIQEEESEVDPF